VSCARTCVCVRVCVLCVCVRVLCVCVCAVRVCVCVCAVRVCVCVCVCAVRVRVCVMPLRVFLFFFSCACSSHFRSFCNGIFAAYTYLKSRLECVTPLAQLSAAMGGAPLTPSSSSSTSTSSTAGTAPQTANAKLAPAELEELLNTFAHTCERHHALRAAVFKQHSLLSESGGRGGRR
jgi:hypothetical protein